MRTLLTVLFAFVAAAAAAQTPPSDSELRGYRGLHAAAASGNVAEIDKLAGAGGKLEDKDGNSRTPQHVAVFMGKRDAALADARACLARDTRPGTLYQLAGVYALTSRAEPADKREALRLLAQALRGGFGLDLLDRDSDLDPVRDDPEFGRLVAAARALRRK